MPRPVRPSRAVPRVRPRSLRLCVCPRQAAARLGPLQLVMQLGAGGGPGGGGGDRGRRGAGEAAERAGHALGR